MAACATGCTLRDKHHTTCSDDTCRGCLPRPVTPPLRVCDTCRSRLAGAIGRTPPLITHLRAMIEPGAAPRPDTPQGKRDAPPAPLNVAAMSAADDLVALLVHWADWITTRRDIAAVRGVLRGDLGQGIGLPGLRQPDLRVCALLVAHLDWGLEQPEAGEMVGEITALVHTTEAKWPTDDGGAWSQVRCSECGSKSVYVGPPGGKYMPRHIACRMDQCGRSWTEDEWDRYVTSLAEAKETA